jgi:hypothetical protein
MDLTEKPAIARPRVVHGPHRIRLSGIPAGRPASSDVTPPTVVVGESEIVTETEEVTVQIVPLEQSTSSQ